MDDLIAAIIFILETPDVEGPINFCSPNPVRNRDFAGALGQVLNRPSVMRTPAFMIRMIMGEMGKSLMSSQRAIPDKLLKQGFKFQYPDINNALYNLTAS
jgi:NAD dependent epimerase/dehydratase family enzyme